MIIGLDFEVAFMYNDVGCHNESVKLCEVDMSIQRIDPNFKTKVTIDPTGYRFYDARELSLYGVFYDGECYRRMPKDVAESANEGVKKLSKYTSGGRVRFVTNSKRIAIRAVMPSICRMAHMAYTGIHGFDMYADEGDGARYFATFTPRTDIEGGYESEKSFGSEKERLITINMPLYNSLTSLEIGIDEGAYMKAAPDYKYKNPIVFYGSSITQGGCASRPGMCYAAILSRKLDADIINLGFSGSGKGEACVAKYIASLEMSAFVLDYDHNAPTPEHLESTHKTFFDTVRTAHPELPIIMTSRPKSRLSEGEIRRRGIIEKTYLDAKASGDRNVYFISGEELVAGLCDEGTVDGIHLTDLGFNAMASGLYPILKLALLGGKNDD